MSVNVRAQAPWLARLRGQGAQRVIRRLSLLHNRRGGKDIDRHSSDGPEQPAKPEIGKVGLLLHPPTNPPRVVLHGVVSDYRVSDAAEMNPFATVLAFRRIVRRYIGACGSRRRDNQSEVVVLRNVTRNRDT